MEIEVLHSSLGDKRKALDTTTEAGRQAAAVYLNKLFKQGVAVFVERGAKAYRVKAYDPKTDRLMIDIERHGETKRIRASGRKSKATAVAPQAGGG